MKNILDFRKWEKLDENLFNSSVFVKLGSILTNKPSYQEIQKPSSNYNISDFPGSSDFSNPTYFSSSRNDEDSCKNNDCWTWFGKEKFWNGVNKVNNKTVPKITIDKSPTHFNISYDGSPSGFLLKHKFGGKGDTIHQLLNVLTLELNSYLETIYAKPALSRIKMDLRGNKLSVYVPLEKSSEYYEIHRRGGLGHGGDFSDLDKYRSKKGYEESIHKSGRLTEKFITFVKMK